METISSVLILGFFDTLWSWAVYAAFGLIAGSLAKWIMPGKDPGGIIVTIIIGIIGAVLGGGIRTFLGMSSDGEVSFFSPMDWIFSILGAVILLFVWKKVIAPILAKK